MPSTTTGTASQAAPAKTLPASCSQGLDPTSAAELAATHYARGARPLPSRAIDTTGPRGAPGSTTRPVESDRVAELPERAWSASGASRRNGRYPPPPGLSTDPVEGVAGGGRFDVDPVGPR